ncbi:hypothetical protein PVAP13_5NG091100 [Panicum virgatum]|uniref:Uncharacterized protein n=1 Tax=Panicum virgatum TaxID=38727 RepID=A0A8T0RN98_PANVG|nr:hypothetical protein PVAP13_5NG091100 [Panicum virgatum]
MGEWTNLADRVQRTLLAIADGTNISEFFSLVDAAYLKLATIVDISRRTLMGATDAELDAIRSPPPHGHSTFDLIERARFHFDLFRGRHAMAGHFFALYGAHLGLLQGDPLWQTWEGHHATAIQNADGALQRLRFAAASCQAMVDAYATARSFHPWSPAWIAWVSAWQSLALRATSGVTKVVFMVRLMRRPCFTNQIDACRKNLLVRKLVLVDEHVNL